MTEYQLESYFNIIRKTYFFSVPAATKSSISIIPEGAEALLATNLKKSMVSDIELLYPYVAYI